VPLFQPLLEGLGLVHFRTTLDGQLQCPSSLEASLTGYSLDELANMRRVELYADPQDRDSLVERAKQAKGEPVRAVVRVRCKEPSETFMAATDIRVVYDALGKVSGFEGVYRAVDERLAWQAGLGFEHDKVLTDKELVQRVRRGSLPHDVDYLLAVDHELRVPLGDLAHRLRNLLQRRVRPDQGRRALDDTLDRVRFCISRVERLKVMGDLLKDDTFRPENRTVSLAKLCHRARTLLSYLARDRRINVSIDTPSLQRFCQARGHDALLYQVVVNLLHNAIKYSRSESEIIVRGTVSAEGRVLEMSNEGIPIPPEDRQRIFDRGYRTKAAKLVDVSGVGLGLWLCQRILECHHYRIMYDQTRSPPRNVFRVHLGSAA